MILHTLTFAMHVLVHSFGPARRFVSYFMPNFKNMASKALLGSVKDSKNSPHLKTGDPLPPFKGILRVYNMRYCPFAQRAVLVLNAKNIEYDVVNCNLMEKPEWLFEKSEFGKVPAIELKDGTTLCESLIVADYLDEIYNERKLLPSDPLLRAKDRMLIQHSDAIHLAFFRALKFPEKLTDDNIKAHFKSLEKIQNELISRQTKFLSGNQPGYVDYMIWPWFERLPVLAKYINNKFEIDQQKFQPLLTYIENMNKDPAVEEYLIDEKTHLDYFKCHMKGEARYDFLDNK